MFNSEMGKEQRSKQLPRCPEAIWDQTSKYSQSYTDIKVKWHDKHLTFSNLQKL